ncbi:CRTAC1 family protein [Altibacter sp. HG106]|uniref:CRTAC1 family protein n=1 Tax=Altibacter sp. HG106 TaxID=3023937 RepID=UPI00234FD5DA|nr:CRTAC1 family protein [Altibacter sp. HG106]MDC7994255.1 CRTAC1 family protein [Altibacter sp. HG106]
MINAFMRQAIPYLWILILATSLLSCNHNSEESQPSTAETPSLFTKLSAEDSGLDFTNTVVNQKDFNIFKYRNFYNGGGVAIGDVNNDGLADIYLTANMGENKLFLNKGNMTFEDITATAGVAGNKPWSTGVTMVDINNDGLLDIYVSNAGNMEGNNHDNDLYMNNGDLTFTEMADEYNLAKTGFSTHATFFDYDKDGDLDAYILNNSNVPVSSLGFAHQRDVRAQNWDIPKIFRGVGDMLLRNDGDTFTEVSEEAGIYGSLIGFGLGVMISDVNNDLYPDIYVSNDFYERDYLYINNQDGTFTEDIKSWMSHLCLSAMGVDMADINNDGNADVFITDMLPDGDQRVKSVMEFEGYNVFKLKQSKDFHQQYIQNTLQLNNGNGTFSEIAYYSGISATDWSWSGLMFDMDNDGFRDIFITNGINHDLTDLDFVDFFANEIIQKMALTGKKEAIDSIINKMPVVYLPNYAYSNNKDLTFSNKATEWGLGEPSLSNGAAYGDLDNDGDLDLVVNNVNMPSFLYRNNTNEQTDNNFVKLRFEGPEKNRFAIGTTIKMYYDDQVVLQEMIPSRGFQSSMEYGMTIGLGAAETIDSIRVIWPDDQTTLLTNITANQTLQLLHSEASERYIPRQNAVKTLFTERDNSKLVKHEENTYVDFDFEGMINRMVSQEGPAVAVGDIDGDGNEDIFTGGAVGQPGMLYRHQGKGALVPKPAEVFSEDATYEDTAASFFDMDGDGDLDLAVGSGGNQVTQTIDAGIRLYKNDGKGNFTRIDFNQPPSSYNVSVITPADMDDDGDIDLFVGSRSVVGIYGVTPKHRYLENQGDGTFLEKPSVVEATKTSGMITDATWLELNNTKVLVTVSDWGAPEFYQFSDGKLQKNASPLANLKGWWNTIHATDIDQDGDVDFIFGNQGENIHYTPSETSLIKLWINDFDNNGTIEQIMTQQIDGRDMPIHQKKEIVSQLVKLKKQNLKASEYAKKSIQELFPEETLARATVREVATSSSVIAINNGDGTFGTKPLPARAQLSCVCGIACTDVNNDGNLDIVLGGNDYEFKPQYSRLDANYGSVLLNDGNMNFSWEDYNSSGFFVREEVKHIATFKDRDGVEFFYVAINNQKPKVFATNE